MFNLVRCGTLGCWPDAVDAAVLARNSSDAVTPGMTCIPDRGLKGLEMMGRMSPSKTP